MEEAATKRCPRCGQTKPLDAFYRRRGNGRVSYCKDCIRLYQRQPRIITVRRFVRSYKDGKPCIDCGIGFPHYILDFDHRPGCQKKANINVLVKKGASVKVILEEIAKCDLVCANCHRRRTWERKIARATDKMEALLAKRNSRV